MAKFQAHGFARSRPCQWRDRSHVARSRRCAEDRARGVVPRSLAVAINRKSSTAMAICRRFLVMPSPGAALALGTRFISAARAGAGFEASFSDHSGGGASSGSPAAALSTVPATAHMQRQWPSRASMQHGFRRGSLPKGSYCSVSGRSAFKHLIYPIPVPGALGTHVTLDLKRRKSVLAPISSGSMISTIRCRKPSCRSSQRPACNSGPSRRP